jgi:asparagine synthase (glutamine-hydrolysing)
MQSGWDEACSGHTMCGIYGFAGFHEDGLLDRMGRVLRHRGPDGEGYFMAREGRPFAMGMRRLAIIDLSGGGQPIFSEDRTVAVVQNGEIYNYLELTDELRAKGHLFKTGSDTEVLVHGYEEWGMEGLLTRLNGMFAFCVHDAKTGGFFLARDRCGQKPLYYTQSNGRFLFASEVKALLQSAHVEARPNVRAIDPYLTLRNVPEPQTMFAGIYTLPAAHYLHHDASGNVSVKRYWEIQLLPGEGHTYKSDDDYFGAFEALWHDSVKLCMRSDVPVGAYLSAGVDSSLTVAAMTKHSSAINTYCIGFGAPTDETPAAAETAKFLGVNHHEIITTAADFNLLPEIVWHMDRPVGDALIIAFYKLAQGASKDLKVVLGGEGADEAFAGYEFHKVISLVEKYRRLMPRALHRGVMLPGFQLTPWKLMNLFSSFPAALGSKGKQRLHDFLKNYDRRDLNHNYNALRTLWSMDDRRDLYADEFKSLAGDAWMGREREGDKGGPFLDRLLKLQYDEWLQDWALIRQDKNTMAHSLEYRLPFLDHRLIELAFTLPAHLKINRWTDKVIERRLADKIFPKHIARRTKKPFYLPVEFFFDHPEFKTLVADTLNPEQLKKRGYFNPRKVAALIESMNTTREFVYCKQVMSLVILELWHRAFVDRQYSFGDH